MTVRRDNKTQRFVEFYRFVLANSGFSPFLSTLLFFFLQNYWFSDSENEQERGDQGERQGFAQVARIGKKADRNGRENSNVSLFFSASDICDLNISVLKFKKLFKSHFQTVWRLFQLAEGTIEAERSCRRRQGDFSYFRKKKSMILIFRKISNWSGTPDQTRPARSCPTTTRSDFPKSKDRKWRCVFSIFFENCWEFTISQGKFIRKGTREQFKDPFLKIQKIQIPETSLELDGR